MATQFKRAPICEPVGGLRVVGNFTVEPTVGYPDWAGEVRDEKHRLHDSFREGSDMEVSIKVRVRRGMGVENPEALERIIRALESLGLTM